MTAKEEKKVAIKAAELLEAIKEELQAEKQEAETFIHDLKDAAREALEDTKVAVHNAGETVKKNLHDKVEEIGEKKDKIVVNTAEALKEAIDSAKCALTKDECRKGTAEQKNQSNTPA